MRVGNLRSSPPVLGDGLKLLVEPVVCVDEKDVIARADDPAQPRLPAEKPAHRIVLDVVHQRNPGIELVPHNCPDQAGGKVSLRQLNAIPFPLQIYEKTPARPKAQFE